MTEVLPSIAKEKATVSAPAPESVSVADELAKLAKLRDDGVLTPDEFAAQKAKLLG
ncbi:SHOCT domain-containing protein [Mycolicibacterium sp. P1-5]|uniref:SHOCT domain-containing protein n=1 Tax=Mycolicibacterium sp. P1-5 TaxID=2024617 RepID=UPI001D14AAA5|nr:SHOCT domain-containing protein [Mycolicibacterium sp. P1-5]